MASTSAAMLPIARRIISQKSKTWAFLRAPCAHYPVSSTCSCTTRTTATSTYQSRAITNMSRSRSADPSSSSSSNTLVGSAYHHPDSRQIVNHMKKLFSELEPPFSSELAMRVVTHKGAISPNATASRSQHNERLSFLGKFFVAKQNRCR